jgi:hypothetical protein
MYESLLVVPVEQPAVPIPCLERLTGRNEWVVISNSVLENDVR